MGLLDTRRGTAYTRLLPEGEQMKPGSVWIYLARVHKPVRTGNGDKISKATVTATNENCGLISMVLQKTGK